MKTVEIRVDEAQTGISGRFDTSQDGSFLMDTTQTSRRPILRPTIEFRVLDDLSSVAVDPESGQAHALTPVATAIIERCDGNSTAQEIVAEIVEIFDCTPSQAEQDVMSFLEDLAQRELVDW